MKTTESFPVRAPRCASSASCTRSRLSRAMTLVEVLVAMGLLTITTLGILGTFLQSRRTTNFQKNELLVDTLVQGILEQLKNKAPTDLLANPVPRLSSMPAGENCLTSMSRMLDYITAGNPPLGVNVELDTNPGNTVSRLILSPLPYVDPSAILPGAIPADGAGSPSPGNGYGDINGDSADDVGVNTIFLDVKGTNGLDGSTNDTSDDIRVNLMVWIRDTDFSKSNLSTGGNTLMLSRGIFINYTWTYSDGRNTTRMISSVRGISKPLHSATP